MANTENAQLPGEPKVRCDAGLDGDEILEALKECEHALKMAIEKDKIGWLLQQAAHQTACDALNKHLAAKKSKPSNDPSSTTGLSGK